MAETIVVGCDGSKAANAALDAACELGGAEEPLVCVTAWRELRADFGLPLLDLLDPSPAEIEREWATSVAAAAAARAAAAGAHAEPLVRHGQPARTICTLARERGARLVVVGSHGWGDVEGALVGSALTGILRGAPCPVLVVPAPEPRNPGRSRAPAADPAA